MSFNAWKYDNGTGCSNPNASSTQPGTIGIQDVASYGTGVPDGLPNVSATTTEGRGEFSRWAANSGTMPGSIRNFGSNHIVRSGGASQQQRQESQIDPQTIAQLMHLQQEISDWNSAQHAMQLFPWMVNSSDLTRSTTTAPTSQFSLGRSNDHVGVQAAAAAAPVQSLYQPGPTQSQDVWSSLLTNSITSSRANYNDAVPTDMALSLHPPGPSAASQPQSTFARLLTNNITSSLANLGDSNYHGIIPAAIYQTGPTAGNQSQGILSSNSTSVVYSEQGGGGGVARRNDNNVATSTPYLPMRMSHPSDIAHLSDHQIFLRQQIDIFAADENDIDTYTRGRNRGISLGQVGIRCRHCAHMPLSQRPIGTRYFPATTLGLYQAAQNMSSTHIQCGRCPCMSEMMNQQFIALIPSKQRTSTGGRVYWSNCAKEMGLIDTDNGIRMRTEE